VELDPSEKHRYQLAAAAEARLSNPKVYWRELAAAPGLLQPDEDVMDLLAAHCGRVALAAGLLLETTYRLLFLTFGFVRRRPRVRSVRFDEIDRGTVNMVGRDPEVILTLRSGKKFRLQGTRTDREQFSDLLGIVERRIGSKLDKSGFKPRR
jgi:hypothetical protein